MGMNRAGKRERTTHMYASYGIVDITQFIAALLIHSLITLEDLIMEVWLLLAGAAVGATALWYSWKRRKG